MENGLIIGLVALLVAGGAAAFLLSQILGSQRQRSNYRNLMSTPAGGSVMDRVGVEKVKGGGRPVVNQEELERLKLEKGKQAKKGKRNDLEARFFKAGMFTKREQDEFKVQQWIFAIVMGSVGSAGALYLLGADLLGPALAIISFVVGYRIPSMRLDSKIKARDEDILYFLPLVIEQIAIGISSSLDIGPCLSTVVKMADERGSHNCVTELIRHSQYYVKSGATLEESLCEVGELSHHTELNHAFMSLAQVSKHGGEVSKQIQELADAVSMQRETKVEERIKKLELKATGPVALAFFGFMIILISGFFIQVANGLK